MAHPSGPTRTTCRRGLAVLLLLALAACSSGDDGDGDGDAADAESTSTESEPATTSSSPGEVPAPEEVPADDVDGFRAAPDPVPDIGPGHLVRYQEAGRVAGAPAFRVMYTSETLDGRPTVVTGTVVVPTGEAPQGGWPVLTHGHGSTGLADDCAPSRAVGSDEPSAGLATVELEAVAVNAIPAGFVVASSDYEGQGGPGRHPFLAGPSEGRSLLDAARAAGELPGVEVDGRVAVAGYSQGGHAALWAQQVAADWAPELDLVGTLAGAPVTRVLGLAERDGGVGAGSLTVAAGMAVADPELDLDAILTPEGASALEALDASCTAVIDVSPGTPLLTVDVTTDPTWRAALEANDPGLAEGTGPVLIVHSAADANVPLADGETGRDRLCARGQPVELRVLPDGDHVAAAVPAYRQGVAWLRGLLDGETPASDCP